MPSDPFKRAQVRQICEVVNSGIQPLQNKRVREMIRDKFKEDMIKWCHYWNLKGMQALEKHLEKSGGEFCVGDEPTMADCFLVAQAHAAFNRFGITEADFPTLSRIYQNLIQLPWAKSTLPPVTN